MKLTERIKISQIYNHGNTETGVGDVPYKLSRYIQSSNSNAISNGIATMAWHGAHCDKIANQNVRYYFNLIMKKNPLDNLKIDREELITPFGKATR